MDPSKRIVKEVEEIRRDVSSGVKVEVDESNSKHLVGSINGPEDTPYHKGLFKVDIVIPGDYPFTPPKMKFLTKIWHPNVSIEGDVELAILKRWNEMNTLRNMLLELVDLFKWPDLKHVVNHESAHFDHLLLA